MYLLEFLNAIRNIGTQYTYIAGDPCDLKYVMLGLVEIFVPRFDQ